jgi:HEAT repeat protein
MTKNHRFPGFERCLKMMRHSNPAINEEGYGLLAPRATKFLSQLIASFWDEDNAAIRGWLVELVAAAQSPAALPFLVERLGDPNECVRDFAIYGLRQLNTKEARTALWQAGLSTRPHDQESGG